MAIKINVMLGVFSQKRCQLVMSFNMDMFEDNALTHSITLVVFYPIELVLKWLKSVQSDLSSCIDKAWFYP